MKGKYLLKLTSAILAISMIFGSMLSANAVWDGYKPEDGGTEIKILDTNRVSDILSAGVLPTENTTGGDRYSIRWKSIKSPTSIRFYNVPCDWSDFSSIRFSVYTEKPTTGTIRVRVYTERGSNPKVPYFQTQSVATTDHTGWKEFKFKMSDFTDYYPNGTPSWEKVTSIAFSGIAGTDTDGDVNYCISSVYADTAEAAPELKLDASEEGKKAVFETLGQNTAIMNFSNNVIKDGKILPVKVADRITTDHSGSIAKFGLFTNVLGAEINDENGKVTITLDGVTADVSEHLVTYDDGKYLKVNPTLKALGKTAKTYDMVTIIGDEKVADKIFDDAEMLNDLQFMLNVSVLTQKDITQADWDLVKKQWTEYIVGPNDGVITPTEREKIDLIDAEYERNKGALNKDPKILAFFGGKSISTMADVISQYYKLKDMAKAYATYGSKYYKDPSASRLILKGLEWLYENGYGMDEFLGQGIGKTGTGNNWTFHIGIPMELTDILLLLGDSVSQELIEKYLFIFQNTQVSDYCAEAGRIYAGTLSNILHQDYDELIKRNSDYMHFLRSKTDSVDEIAQKGKSESGVKEDWLYITHYYYAYTAAYGCTTLLDRLATVESILMGTNFEFVNPYKYDPVMWMRETFGPIAFNGALTAAQSGRFRGSDSFSEANYAQYMVASSLDLIGCFGKDDDEYLKQLIKRNVVKENEVKIRNFLNTYQTELLDQILADETIVVEPYYKSKMYYTGDSAVHQRDNFGFAVAMSSSRIGAWESLDGQNITGWYQGDGMLYTYLKDDVNQYNRQYWKFVNPYHLPGTTVDTQPRIPASIKASARTLTKQDFVGGVQFEDDYLVSAMQLEGHKNEATNPDIQTTKSGDAPNHHSSLLAKKAWFLFDDEAVALGTDINANDGFEVQTVVENRKLNITEDRKIEKKETTPAQKVEGVTEYKIVGVKGPSSEDANPPENSFDGDMLTYWVAPGDVDWVWEIEKVSPIGYVGIAQRNGTEGKQAIFELEVSTDGKTWTQVFAGKASGQTKDMEAYDAKGKEAKFIRYVGHGRTNSKNNVITEIKIFGPTADGKPPVAALTKMPDEGAQTTTKDPNANKILGAEKILVDGTLLEKESNYKKEFENPKWAHIENVGGYYFPMGGSLKMDKVTNDKLNFLEMWFTHGVSPKDGAYSYVVLPTKTPEETEAYTKSPDIEILSNTKALQAVREKTLGMTGIVFWEAGKFEEIEASVPMIMMTKDKDADGKYQLTLSDPTKLLKEGKVTLNGEYQLLEGDKRLTVTLENGKTVISIDFWGASGRSLPIILLAK